MFQVCSNHIKLLSIGVFLFFSNNLFSYFQENKEGIPIRSTLREFPFLENKGQFFNIDNTKNKNILFKAGFENLDCYITDAGITYTTFVSKPLENLDDKSKKLRSISYERIDMKLTGAIIDRKNIVKKNLAPYFYSYYKQGIQKEIRIKPTNKILIKDVYPNIDWLIYSNDQGIKYDFIVNPGGNPKDIVIEYESLSPVSLNDEGELEINHKFGQIKENKPISYQHKNAINTNFKILSSREIRVNSEARYITKVSFVLPKYKKDDILTIDPQLEWGSFFGGNDNDGPLALTTDNNDNLFAVGYTGSVNFPTIDNQAYFQGTFVGGNSDGFLLKFDNNSNLLWGTFYGGSDSDVIQTIKSDGSGNVYLGGFTNSIDFPTQNFGGYNQLVSGGSRDAVILKFDNNGNRLWATYFGGSNNERINSIDLDQNGNLFVTGSTTSNDIPYQNNGTYSQATNAGNYDAFVSKFDVSGNLQWSTYYGGSGSDLSESICLDNIGNLIITGNTSSTDFPTQDNGTYFQGNNGGGKDAFIVKFDNNGSRIYGTYYGGTDNDFGKSLDTDANNNLFIAGGTGSMNFPTQNAGTYFQSNNAGTNDAFIAKFNVNGNRIWSTYFGGNDIEWFGSFQNLEVDDCNNIFMAFHTSSPNIPTQSPCDGGFYDGSFNGGDSDQYIAKFSNQGDLLWGTFAGGNGRDIRSPIAVSNSGRLYISGEWTHGFGNIDNTTYPLLNNLGGFLDNSNNGMDDGFFMMFSPTSISSNISKTDATCGCNGMAEISVSNGCMPIINWYDSLWTNLNNNDSIINNLCPGTYHAIVSDSLVCPYGIDTIDFVIQPGNGSGFTFDLDSIDVSCNGSNDGSVWVSNINGGFAPYSYSWNSFPGQTNDTLVNLVAGTYTLTITDSSGCTSTESITVNEPSPLTDSMYSENISCFGLSDGVASINVMGGTQPYSYNWNINPPINNDTINSLTSGLYIVSVNDDNGCSITDSIILEEPSQLSLNIDSIETTCGVCDGGLNSNVNGGIPPYDYQWSNGASNNSSIDSLCAGSYSLIVTDSNGCSVNDTSIVTSSQSIGQLTVNSSPANCYGSCDGSAIIDTSNIGGIAPYQFNWLDSISGNPIGQNGIQGINLCAGNYIIEVTDSIGCQESYGVTINQPSAINVDIDNDTIICSGNNISLTASVQGAVVPYSYSWTDELNNLIGNNDTLNVTPTNDTTYYVTVTDANNCSSVDSVNVEIYPPLTFDISSDVTICKGDSVLLEVMNIQGGSNLGYTYNWTDGVQTLGTNSQLQVFPNSNSTYYLTVSNSCESVLDSVNVFIDSIPVEFQAARYGCEPFTTQFINLTPGTNDCVWNFGDGTNGTGCIVNHTYTSSGFYDVTLTVSNSNGCSSTHTELNYIEVYPKPIANFYISPSNPDILNPIVNFNNTSLDADSYIWSFEGVGSSTNINPTVTFPEEPGNYEVNLIANSEEGCSDTTRTIITIMDQLIFYVPNTFTPDNDDFNETFQPVFYSGYDPQDYTLLIFNRWGELIFESHNTSVGWDGTYGNKKVKDGTYIWKIEFKESMSDKRHTHVGHVNVLK